MVGLENKALYDTSNFPIRHEGDVHSGKVRGVYWLTKEDSKRLIGEKGYMAHPDSQLGAMVISDRISAFECGWLGQDGLMGVPGKGAALNAISQYWFKKFKEEGYAGNHIVDTPHPLVWIVQRAQPIMVEAIARQYITGSMWRDYKKGDRTFCGISIPDGLRENQRLEELLVTPSTKGIMMGIPGVPEDDDVNITRDIILCNYDRFGYNCADDVDLSFRLLKIGFRLIGQELISKGEIFVDTKFEFGYMKDRDGKSRIGYIDEVGTPDSSRIWNAEDYKKGKITEKSKEGFRQFLIKNFGEVMPDKTLFGERKIIAKHYRVPVDQFMEVSYVYRKIAEKITGERIREIENPREEIMDVMSKYGLAA